MGSAWVGSGAGLFSLAITFSSRVVVWDWTGWDARFGSCAGLKKEIAAVVNPGGVDTVIADSPIGRSASLRASKEVVLIYSPV